LIVVVAAVEACVGTSAVPGEEAVEEALEEGLDAAIDAGSEPDEASEPRPKR
jgi:hypothetical protein